MMFKENLVVAVKADNKYLKDIGNQVFLPFGTEYSLFFRNKDTRRALVGPVMVDGKDVLNGTKVILSGNSEWNLEGGGKAFDPTQTKNYRFKFIEKTAKISQHRGDDPSDGLVSVTFQYETSSVIVKALSHISSRDTSLSRRVNLDDMIIGGCAGTGEATNALYSMNMCDNSMVSSASSLKTNFAPQKSGMTTQGSSFDQNYSEGRVGDLDSNKHVLTFGLYGQMGNGEDVKEVITPKTKLTCATCGTENPFNGKFCGECGTNLT